MAYQPRPETLATAKAYLLAHDKVLPAQLATAINSDPKTAQRLCRYLNDQGVLIKHGRGYVWNWDGAADRGPLPDAYVDRVCKLTDLILEELRQRNLHNKLLARAYFGGTAGNCNDDYRQTLTLEAIKTDLLHMADHLDWVLLTKTEERISLDLPKWAGQLYRRTRDEREELSIAVRQAKYAEKKRRNRKPNPMVRAGIEERRKAFLAQQAAEFSARMQQKEAEALLLKEQIAAADDTDAAMLADALLRVTPSAGIREVVQMAKHYIAPYSPGPEVTGDPAEGPHGPMITDAEESEPAQLEEAV